MFDHQSMMFVTDRMVTDSIIDNKFFADYGKISSIDSDGKHCDVAHAILETYDGVASDTALITRGIEILYLSGSSISIDTTPVVGDPVLLIGLRKFIYSTDVASDPTLLNPSNQYGYCSYDQSTMKAIPLSAVNSSAGLTIRAKNSKLRIRNSTVSLYKTLNDLTSALNSLTSALNSFATSESALYGTISAITAPIPGTTFAPFIAPSGPIPNLITNVAQVSSSITSVTNEISSLLED